MEDTLFDYFIIGADAAGLSSASQIKRERPNATINPDDGSPPV